MRILLIIATLVLLAACEQQKTASERTGEIETFADPQIRAYEKAKTVQGTIDAAHQEQKEDMRKSDL